MYTVRIDLPDAARRSLASLAFTWLRAGSGAMAGP